MFLESRDLRYQLRRIQALRHLGRGVLEQFAQGGQHRARSPPRAVQDDREGGRYGSRGGQRAFAIAEESQLLSG